MKASEILYCRTRQEWRSWLAAHFEDRAEIWFVFPTKASGEAGVSYNDAVEEALCFGWIDGQANALDERRHVRRFTPRRKGSSYSRPNIERLIRLDGQGLLHPKVREEVRALIETPFVFPEDILEAIRADAQAWERYLALPEPYRRIRVAYIDAARGRGAEFDRRLRNFIRKTREGRLISGYGGIGKYYAPPADEAEAAGAKEKRLF